MFCRSCGYALWNLKERTCPECGSAFRPSEFRFHSSAVRFCCPHCGQDYYGTSPEGHLEPRRFECVRCKVWVDMDQMVLLPTEGVKEEQTRLARQPWLERGPDARWLGARWFTTAVRAMGTPGPLMSVTPPGSSPGDALGFALITWLVWVALAMGPGLLFMFVGIGAMGGLDVVRAVLIALGVLVLLPVLVVLGWAALTHALLRLTGEPAHPWGRTVQAIGYSSGVNMGAAIPCVGFYLAPVMWVWWVISATVMVKEGQKVPGGRAVLAVLVPPALVLALVVAVFTLGVIPAIRRGVAGMQATMAQAMPTLNDMWAQDFARMLQARAGSGQGWPVHVAELLAAGQAMPQQFLTDGSATAPGLSFGGVTLESLTYLQGTQKDDALRQLLAVMPADVVAYRVGDYVFTYPEVDPQDQGGGFWVFVAEEQPSGAGIQAPAGGPPVRPGKRWLVGLNDGSVRTFGEAEFDAALAEQNAAREAAGMTALPAPGDITLLTRSGATQPPGNPQPNSR